MQTSGPRRLVFVVLNQGNDHARIQTRRQAMQIQRSRNTLSDDGPAALRHHLTSGDHVGPGLDGAHTGYRANLIVMSTASAALWACFAFPAPLLIRSSAVGWAMPAPAVFQTQKGLGGGNRVCLLGARFAYTSCPLAYIPMIGPKDQRGQASRWHLVCTSEKQGIVSTGLLSSVGKETRRSLSVPGFPPSV